MAGKPLLNQDFFGKTHVKPQKSQVVKSLTGTIQTPGDKSISHRALMIGGLAVGETNIEGLLEGEDVLATATALRALGVFVEKKAAGTWRVRGLGVTPLRRRPTCGGGLLHALMWRAFALLFSSRRWGLGVVFH